MTIERKQVPSLGRIVLVRGERISRADPFREYPAIITDITENETNVGVMVFVPIGQPFQSAAFDPDMEKTHLSTVWRWPPLVAPKAEDKDKIVLPPVELTYLDRLRIELQELTGRRQKLGAFFGHPDFRGLSAENQTLLDQQQVVMDRYIRILDRRIGLAEKA